MKRPPPPPNEDHLSSVLGYAPSHGDHPMRPEAEVSFRLMHHRFGQSMSGVQAVAVVRCPSCGWDARASDTKYGTRDNPNSSFDQGAIRRIVVQAVNNFKSKVPPSCAQALARFVMSS